MSQLSREEFIELGVSVPTDALTEWAAKQLAATKGRENRLQSRGMSGAYLAGVGDLVGKIQKRQRELSDLHESPPEAAGLAERIREEAVEYWQEAKQMAEVAFGDDPDLLAKFRTGVQTQLQITTLTRELESMVGLFREHSSRLAELGGNQAFIERGVFLAGRLKEVKRGLDAACRGSSPEAAQQWHDKGLLYDLTRKLVRVGRLEFRLDPEQAAAFNFNGVKRKRDVSARPGVKKQRIEGREPA